MSDTRIALAAHRVHDPSNPRRGEPRTIDGMEHIAKQVAHALARWPDTEDLTQVARIAIWKAGATEEPLAYTIARRACIDYLRVTVGTHTDQHGRRVLRDPPRSLDRARDEGHPASEGWTSDRTSEIDLRVDFQRAVDSMPNPRHRVIARVYARDEQPMAQAAHQAGYTLNTGYVTWSGYVRPQLRASLADYT